MSTVKCDGVVFELTGEPIVSGVFLENDADCPDDAYYAHDNDKDADRYRKLRAIAVNDGRLDVLEYRTKDNDEFDAIVDALSE